MFELLTTVEHSSTECFGVHLGDPQSANLGDGHGAVNQTMEIRDDFGDAALGTCLESLIGGNHFRYVQLYFNMSRRGLHEALKLQCVPSERAFSQQRSSLPCVSFKSSTHVFNSRSFSSVHLF